MDNFYQYDSDQGLVIEYENPVNSPSKLDPSIYLKVSSILFVRAGLFLSQVSSIPSSNIQILIFQNIIDIGLNTVIYSLIGYLFAFGKDVETIIGIYGFLSDETNRSEFAEGWLIIIAVSGLLIAAIGDRISFFSSLVVNILISGFVWPIFIHWVQSEAGWMRKLKLGKVHVSYKDYGYSCLIHMCGGFLAFISMMILNKRLLRFKDMDPSSIPDNGPSLTLFGNFFMVIGFLGIEIPTEKYIQSHLNYNFYGVVMINTLLSAFGAVTTTLLLTFSCPCEPMHKWTSMRSIQAGISGIAVIAGGADVYHPLASLTVGICNGVVFFVVSFLVNMSPIEDYSNIIACHFVSGLLGTLLPPILGVREGFGGSPSISFMHLTWQILCDLALLSVIIIIFSPVSLILDYCSILRSWDEDINHRRALFASNRVKNVGSQPSGGEPPGEQTIEQTISFSETDYEGKTQEENIESESDNPNVLLEEKKSEIEEKTIDHDLETTESFQKIYTNDIICEDALNFDNRKYLLNYILNSKPLAFFEEIRSDSLHTSDPKIKDCGENYTRTSRFHDIKLIKGIRNISDSKLLHKFKESWPIPKKRTIWNRGQALRFGSASNIWLPDSVRISVETQV